MKDFQTTILPEQVSTLTRPLLRCGDAAFSVVQAEVVVGKGW